MEPRIRNAIARIDIVQDGQSLGRGTGFLVAPELVLTALHVVADRSQDPPAPYPGEIVLQFPNHSPTRAALQEGLWNRQADWALLRCESPPEAPPLPLAEPRRAGEEWQTYGFPDANPRDGMVQAGIIENHLGELEGVPALQLYSRQAAAGNGAPVKGLSGSPVIVENAVVGLLRFALMKEKLTVAGTLYACPISLVLDKCADLLPVPDPCYGLPGLPRHPLPGLPFRYLARFTEKDAEVFFGRNREIRQLYDLLTAADRPPVVLFYGESGVGKSSLLDAGVLPRLGWYHEVRYLRRDAGASLSRTLKQALVSVPQRQNTETDSVGRLDREGSDLRESWLAAETSAGKPLIVFFDQVEEAFTHPHPGEPQEVVKFFAALAEVFGDPGRRPRGRLVLGFRKEWFPEIQKQMEVNGLDYAKVFFERMDRDAVVEAAGGLTLTPRLREHYRLRMDPGLAEIIADDLLEDRSSPIAPTLQILLTKLWKNATARNQEAPEFTILLYQQLKKEGLLLGDFLDQQLEKFEQAHPEWVRSGLVLDVLATHTTSFLTAHQRSLEELRESYAHVAEDLPALLHVCQSLFLLTDAAPSQESAGKTFRLSHDTLAPVVRDRFEKSPRLGQRARRIVESRAQEWPEEGEGEPLGGQALEVVQRGLSGMRALTARESRMLDSSQYQERRRRRRRRLVRAGFYAAAALILALGLTGWILHVQGKKERELAELSHKTDEMFNRLSVAPAEALVIAIQAAGRSLRTQCRGTHCYVLSDLQKALNSAVQEAWEEDVFELQPGKRVRAVAFSSQGVVAAGDNDGVLYLWTAEGPWPGEAPTGHKGPVTALSFSPDGNWLASAGEDGSVRLWNLATARGREVLHGSVTTTVTFSPNGWFVIGGGRDGRIRVWDLEGNLVGPAFAVQSPVVSLAVAQASEDRLAIVTGGEDGVIGVWDLKGRPLIPNKPRFEAQSCRVAQPCPVTALAVHAEPERPLLIASGGRDEVVRLWNERGEPQGEPFRDPIGPVTSLAFNPDGELIACGSMDRTIRLLNRNGLAVGPPFRGFDGVVTSVAFEPNGSRIAAGGLDGTVRLLDPRGNQIGLPLRPEPAASLSDVAYSPDGKIVAAAGESGVLYLWDAETRALLRSRDTGQKEVYALAIHPQEKVLVTAGKDGTLRWWDLEGNPLGEALRGHARAVWCVRFSPDGRLLASGGEDGAVMLWDVGSRQRLHTMTGHECLADECAVHAVAFSPDGKALVSAGQDRTLRFWDLSGKPVARSETEDSIYTLAFSPDGNYLFGGGEDGHLWRWNRDGKRKGRPIKAHSGEIYTLVLDPVHQTIFTAAGDDTIGLWGNPKENWEDDREWLQRLGLGFTGHRGEVYSVNVHPNGQTVVSTGEDGTVRFWHAHWEVWLKMACGRMQRHPLFTEDQSYHTDILEEAKEFCQTEPWKK